MFSQSFEQEIQEPSTFKMFLPTPFDNIECQPVTCEVVRSSEELLRRLAYCGKVRFSGHLALTLSGSEHQACSLYFLDGWLVGGTGGTHPVRRWSRQVARYCPRLSPKSFASSIGTPQLWDYSSLIQQVEQGQISQNHVAAVVRGNLNEMLFDFIQACQSCSTPSEAATGDRSNIQLSYHDFCQNITTPPSILLQPSQVLQPAVETWNAWRKAGLAKYSPNLAPVIQDHDALRQQAPAAYHNLAQSIHGDLTLRDLALSLKQYPILLTRSIMPFVAQGIIGLRAVSDIAASPLAQAADPSARPPTGSPQVRDKLIAYIEDSRFDCATMEQILEQTAYRFLSIRDPLQALPMLLEHKPSLIFLDVLMPVINGYEVCAQIRQISTFKNTPVIIVTSSDGIVDRVRANLTGASDFLAKPITAEKVSAALRTHLPLAPPPSSDLSQERSSKAKPYLRKLELGARNFV
ncbi:MAG: response regulator [Elainellaceae cyanobacterium]